MSSDIKAMMVADVAATALDVSATLTWSRVAVAGTFGAVGKSDDIDADGILQTADAEFVASKAAFTGGVPGVREVVDVDGVKYWIQNATDDDACITLALRRS
jgi:hypothetical protein